MAMQSMKHNRLKETSTEPSNDSRRVKIYESFRSDQKFPKIKNKLTTIKKDAEKVHLRELQSQFSRKISGANMILLQGRAAMKESDSILVRLKNEL